MVSHELNRILEHLPGRCAILGVGPGFVVMAMNRHLRTQLVDPAHAIGRPLLAAFPEATISPDGIAHLPAVLERVIRTRSTQRHRQRLSVSPSSECQEQRCWTFTCSPILDAAGDVEYILQQAEEAPVEEHGNTPAPLDTVLDAMGDGVLMLDRQWRFGYANPSAHHILGQAQGSLLGEVIWARVPYTQDTDFGKHCHRAMHERTVSSFVAHCADLDGWYSATAYPVPAGVAVVLHDVTAAVLSEQARERTAIEAQRRYRIYETALNSTPDFVYIFGTDHRAIYANDALLKVWGVDDVRGKTWMELGYEQWHADLHDREIDQVIHTKAAIRGEIPFAGTNGRRIYDYIFAPVLDEAGDVVAVAGTTRDITDRQAAEQIIREHADRLAEADRAKDEFLATLSHELRNPLAPLRNGLEVLRRVVPKSEPQAAIHAMMERQVDHLVRLVDDLMEVSRITRGHVPLQAEPVALEAMIDGAIEASKPLIDGGGHALSVTLPAHPVHILGDRVRLAQILANLINNAAKYSEPGSPITLCAGLDGDSVWLSVRDRGIGMDPAEIPHLFEMFARGDRVKASRQGGLGIGLALARRLAALHGGTLDARSEGPGQGSIFELRLPTLGTTSCTPERQARAAARLSLKVLLADDNADVGQSLADALRLIGADVRLVDSGLAALETFDDFKPDATILDIGMPRVTGYDVARTLRARGATTPLIALTGWGQPTDRERAFTAGFDHHLVKPVAIPVLVELLTSVELRATAHQNASAL